MTSLIGTAWHHSCIAWEEKELASLIGTSEFGMKIKGIAFKARYIAIGLIALEIASIPVSAKIIEKVAFSTPQKVAAVPFPPEAGITRFLLSSNAPFAIISENAVGEFNVSIEASGELNGNNFGSNAQMPGPAKACMAQTVPSSTKIYAAERKTAAHKGDILTQAIIVEIRYETDIQPDFKVITENKAKRIPTGTTCKTKLS